MAHLPKLALVCVVVFATEASAQIDFNTEVRPILSNNCLLCHGPDEEGVESGLQLHEHELAVLEADSGERAIVPRNPDASEMIARITSDDEYLRMPPAEHGKPLSKEDVATLKQWIAEGAKYDRHWSYSLPKKATPPEAKDEFTDWPKNEIDSFVLAQQLKRGLTPSPAADRRALARRVALDITGLPLTMAETEAFANSTDPEAYEKLVDELLSRPTFGEHWARKWLDLARYADSAGYADDPPRTIWAYRDWVIRSFNDNMPFDQFTQEQLAGDLLPNPTNDQLIATAFHRNTLTNNEGGTQDEEFRSVAVVDRVNTTMAVWMGTTMACAQCHTHKYDPLTQKEYFQFYAVFNNTQDADRRDESPTLPIFTDQQIHQRNQWHQQIADLRKQLNTPTDKLENEQTLWENALQEDIAWQTPEPTGVKRTSGQPIQVAEGIIKVEGEPVESLPLKDTYVVDLPVEANQTVRALKLSAIPAEHLPKSGSGFGGGNFVVTGLKAKWIPKGSSSPKARFVRITQNGKKEILSLAEVQVFSNGKNIAVGKDATQSSRYADATASRAVDGDTNGDYAAKSVTHTSTEANPWWEVDLGQTVAIDKIALWNRTDNALEKRLDNYTITLMDENLKTVWEKRSKDIPKPSTEITPDNTRTLTFQSAVADYHQAGFPAEEALTGKTDRNSGWAIGGSTTKPHQLIATFDWQLQSESAGTLRITIKQQSPHHRHLLGNFKLSTTNSPSASARGSVPADMLAIADQAQTKRSEEDQQELSHYFRMEVAGSLNGIRQDLKKTEKLLAELKPATSVPILREKTSNRRTTHVHHRGSYLDKGEQVEPGVPQVFLTSFEETPSGLPQTRLEIAEWLVSEKNPLTARVLVNRYWETIFGRGIVLTSEEFGSQGELPTHPKLLDWLAMQVMESGWDRKQLIKLLVMSATYQQSSKVTAEKLEADADNRWLARGPRVRHTAEMVRDQALFVSGLLSPKMYGPPVKPPQPDLGLKAAFGSSTDWKTSTGEDRYRRGLYTTWRRSNPYPSMATFDAPNREVCTVRRNSTNTPLQSLVTLNDPAFVEAAQSLARLALQHSDDTAQQIQFTFERCVQRPPSQKEKETLLQLYKDTLSELSTRKEDARKLATDPLGPLPECMEPATAATMTVLCNVLLNLDEMFLKR